MNRGKLKKNKNGLIIFQLNFIGKSLSDECQVFQEQNVFCRPWFLPLRPIIRVLLGSIVFNQTYTTAGFLLQHPRLLGAGWLLTQLCRLLSWIGRFLSALKLLKNRQATQASNMITRLLSCPFTLCLSKVFEMSKTPLFVTI